MSSASGLAELFPERDDLIAAIQGLCADPDAGAAVAADREQERVCTVLEKYQEQPNLLDPALEALLLPVLERIRELMLPELSDAQQDQLHRLCRLAYTISKVRGYKTVVKFFPHEAADLEPTLRLLQTQDRADPATWQTRYVLLLWLSMLALIPFDLSTVDSTLVAAGGDGGRTVVASIIAEGQSYLGDPGAVRDAAAVCMARLLTRPDMEAVHLRDAMTWARQTVVDCIAGDDVLQLTGVLTMLCHALDFGHRTNLLEYLGPLFSVGQDVIGTPRAQGLQRKLAVKLVQRVGLTHLPPRVVAWRYQRGQRSLLANLGAGGDAAAAAAAAVEVDPSTVAGVGAEEDDDDLDVPEAIEDVIEILLCGLRDRDTVVRWSAAKGVGRITSRLPAEFADDIVASVLDLFSESEGDGAWHGGCLALAELARRGLLLPARLGSVVPVILRALVYDVRRGKTSVGQHVRDGACYVCWAFARAYAPEVMAPFVQDLSCGMLVTALFDREVNCRRAASAAFQENVGRQGHDNFPHGIDILTAADYFTLGNRAHAYGEIALFVAGYPRYRYALLDHLLRVKIAHWDVAVRELAAQSLAGITRLEPDYMVHTALPALLRSCLSGDLLVRHGSALAAGEIVLALAQIPVRVPGTLLRQLRDAVPAVEAARLYRGRGGELMRAACCRLLECVALAAHPLPLKVQFRLLDSIKETSSHAIDAVRDTAVAALAAFARAYCDMSRSAVASRVIKRVVEHHVGVLLTNENAAARRGSALCLGVLPAKVFRDHPDELARTLDALCRSTAVRGPVEDVDAKVRAYAVKALADLSCELGDLLSPEQARAAFDAVLAAMDDYSTDEQGDVGSWVRRAAMAALKRMAVLFAALPAPPARPEVVLTPYGRGTVAGRRAAGAIVEVDFARPALGAFHFPYGRALFRADRVTKEDDEEEAKAEIVPPAGPERDQHLHQDIVVPDEPVDPSLRFEPAREYLTANMAARLFRALLKQLAEKMDVVRSDAGSILFELVHAQPPLPHVPVRAALEAALPAAELGAADWSSAAVTFPVVTRLLAVDEFLETIAHGLVVSVGGLTESVVKASRAALAHWIKAAVAQKNRRALAMLARALLGLFELHARDTRVIIPLFKTLDFCLQKHAFQWQGPPGAPEMDWAEQLFQAARAEVKNSPDAVKLRNSVAVFVGLLQFEAPVRPLALNALLALLGHKFPRVRAAAAEQLYSTLVVLEEAVPNDDDVDDVLGILMETSWDGPAAPARAERDKLYPLLGLTKPERVRRGSAGAGAGASGAEAKGAGEDGVSESKAGAKEDESYAALVQDMGY